jgi:hypothetical protein
MLTMDSHSLISLLARIADGRVGRASAGLVLLALAVLPLAFIVGVVAADLLAPQPADILAAPFRW